MLAEQSFELVDLDQLTPHPENPRRGDVAAIAESIEANRFYGAVVAQRSTGRVLVGNHRLLAARAKGLAQVPVLWIDVDDDRARRILLVDNKTNDRAGYDDELLTAVLKELQVTDDGLAGTGFSADELVALADTTDPDFEPDDEGQPRLDRTKERQCPSCGFAWRVAADGSIEPV